MLFASYFIAAGLPACRLSMHNLVLSVAGPRVWNNFHQELHLSLDYLYISRPFGNLPFSFALFCPHCNRNLNISKALFKS